MAMTHLVFFAKSNDIHLPFKDMDSTDISIGPRMDSKRFQWGFFGDCYQDSEGIEWILKDSHKDSSWLFYGDSTRMDVYKELIIF